MKRELSRVTCPHPTNADAEASAIIITVVAAAPPPTSPPRCPNTKEHTAHVMTTPAMSMHTCTVVPALAGSCPAAARETPFVQLKAYTQLFPRSPPTKQPRYE